jgi:hypothetical protein
MIWKLVPLVFAAAVALMAGEVFWVSTSQAVAALEQIGAYGHH